MVDSFGPRNHGEMCSQSGFDRELYLKRPRDAYAALVYLQAQPYVRSDRIGVMGWSEGGGTSYWRREPYPAVFSPIPLPGAKLGSGGINT